MRKGFTLVEVLVSASIIAVVGLALLQTHSHNTKLINRMNTKYHIKEEFSAILLNASQNLDGSSKSFYDILRAKYKFKNDDTIRWLKDKRLDYSQDEFSHVNLLENDLEDFISSFGNIDKSSLPDIRLNIDKVSAHTSEGNSLGYLIRLQ